MSRHDEPHRNSLPSKTDVSVPTDPQRDAANSDLDRWGDSGADWSIVPRQFKTDPAQSSHGSEWSGQDLATQFERSLQRGVLPVLGDYEVLRRVGSGGMGVVFEARDRTTKQSVALKLLQPDLTFNQSAWLRFQKEARVWKEIQSPHVVRCLGFASSAGQHAIVTEFVEGMSLASWLELRVKLSETVGLQIFEGVALGLRSIHEAGVIHRDLKPSNILLETEPGTTRRKSTPTIRLAKVTDFGLAREIKQSESLAMTQTRALLGTPRYLAPEQFSDRPELGATADLYALGVTMFQALTGRSPFDHPDLWQLADQHRYLPPPDPQSINPEISNGLRTILMRLLEKQAEDRYQSAEEVLLDLSRLRQGQPILRPLQLVNVPALGQGEQTTEFRWELKTSVEALWPWVTQTNRVNRAMGLPVPRFTLLSSASAYTHDAQAKLKGLTLHWNEYPFCWIENRMMSVMREFHNGPYRFVISEVELVPRIQGGTLLIHRFHYHCRHVLGRWFARWQIGKSTYRALQTIYQELDEHCQANLADGLVSSALTDGFHLPAKFAPNYRNKLNHLNQILIDQHVAESIRARLEKLILEGTDDELSRIRVYPLAQRWQIAEGEVLRALVLACQAGALKLSWEVVCPKCRLASSQENELTRIREHEHCDVCQYDLKVNFAQNVELVFEVVPAIREVVRQKWCIGGPFHAPHVVAQLYLQPGQTAVLRLSLASGDYELTNPQTDLKFPISVRDLIPGENPERSWRLSLVPHQSHDDVPCNLTAGRQRLTLTNQFDATLLIRLERAIRHDDVMTAAEAATYRVFREVFPHEIVSPQTLLSLDHACFLAIKWRPQASDLRGPAEPTSAPAKQLDRMSLVSQEVVPWIHRSGGDLIDVAEGLLLAMFRDDGLAQACQRELFECRQSPGHPLAQIPFAINLVSGPVVVSHLLGFPKYLGATIDAVCDFEVED